MLSPTAIFVIILVYSVYVSQKLLVLWEFSGQGYEVVSLSLLYCTSPFASPIILQCLSESGGNVDALGSGVWGSQPLLTLLLILDVSQQLYNYIYVGSQPQLTFLFLFIFCKRLAVILLCMPLYFPLTSGGYLSRGMRQSVAVYSTNTIFLFLQETSSCSIYLW